MNIFDRGFKEILTSQIVSIIGGIIAGTVLAVYTDKILLIPGMLILLPGFLEMRGNISGTFASRLSSGLFLGVINPKKMHTKLVRGNVLASLLLAILVSLVLGVVAYFFSLLVFDVSTPKIILIPVFAGVLASLVEIPITLLATFFLFRKGHDPNNIMGPFVTSTGDVTSVLSLLVALVLI